MDLQETNASVIKHYARKLLADGQRHSRKEIIEYVEKITGRDDFTQNNFSGSIRDLMNEKGYGTVGRGWYQYTGSPDSAPEVKGAKNIKESITIVLGNTIERIEYQIKTLNPLELSNDDLKEIAEVKKTIELINVEIERLSSEEK